MLDGIEKYRTAGAPPAQPNRHQVHVDNDGSQFSPIADPHENERRGSNSGARNEAVIDLDDDHSAAAGSSSGSSAQSGGDNSDVDVFAIDDDSDDALNTTQDEKLLVPTDHNHHHDNKKRKSLTNNDSSKASANSSRSLERTATRRRSAVITNSDLVDLWTKLSVIDKEQTSAQFVVDRIIKSVQTETEDSYSSLVGSELLNAYTRCRQNQERLQEQMVLLHGLANQRHTLEQEIVRYLRWTQKTVSQDSQDLVFCNELEQKLKAYRKVHVAIKAAHDELVHEEEQAAMAQRERERIQQEKDEAEKFKQEALKKETEAREGMVWNPTTREYQALDTTEAWRD
jgi:hypothetical protein